MLGDIFTAIIAGLGGSILGVRYSEFVQKREYKALLVLLIQEYTLILDRSTTYYKVFVKGGDSFSSLFQLSDNNTFLKLVKVSDDIDCIKTSLKLKADFFQVEKHVLMYSKHLSKFIDLKAKGYEPLAVEEYNQALSFLSMAMNFFIGDKVADGKFQRKRFNRYIDKIIILINKLKSLNDKRINSIFYSKKKVIDTFINSELAKLEHIRYKIRLLREMEEIQFNKQPQQL